MRLSVVTACLNRAETLPAALRSLAVQDHGNVEHVVQDGGSTDGTLALLRHLSPSASVVSASDRGLYDALNRGVARARGEAIALLHSDDAYAHPRVLSRAAEALGADPDLDGVYGDVEFVDAGGRIVRRWRAGVPGRLAFGWMPPHAALVLRARVYRRWGGYDPSFRIAGDYEAMLRWMLRGRVRLGYLPGTMVRMRVGGASNGTLGRSLLRGLEDLQAIRRHRIGGAGTLALKRLRKLGQLRPV